MFTTFNTMSIRAWFVDEAPQLVAAMAIAELAFRFHSFSLECMAFLVTWWTLGALRNSIR